MESEQVNGKVQEFELVEAEEAQQQKQEATG